MQILVNGQTRSAASGLALPALLEELKLAGRLAVELNGAIVPRSAWPGVRLQEGDRVEIVHAVGGG
jgi:sulfur carrier protein